jgi:capsular polysaccharide biosynthesis protein
MYPVTPYADLYRNINPHLHTTPDSEVSPVTFQVDTVYRNPPKITNDEQIVRNNLRRVFGFTDAFYERHPVHFPVQALVVKQDAYVSSSTVIDVRYRWCTEYYHFLTEVLPNVLYLRSKFPDAPICCTKSAFTEPLFRWFGIRSPILDAAPTGARRLTTAFAQCGNPSRQSVQLIRNVVESKLSFERTMGILIRRHGTRFIENESELLEECMRTFPNLIWVIFDQLSSDETVQLFSKAAVIVAPHGAGLTNMLFSSKGIDIYEFMPIDHPNMCYWHLSELMENKYTMIPTRCHPSTHSMKCSLGNVAVDYGDEVPSGL